MLQTKFDHKSADSLEKKGKFLTSVEMTRRQRRVENPLFNFFASSCEAAEAEA